MRFRLAMVALALRLANAQGQEADQGPDQEQSPDLDFLEYLGTWAEEDDEWLAIEEWEKDTGAEPEEKRRKSDRNEDDDDESD